VIVETNQISRDWTVLHEGRTFYVNFTESDGQTLALAGFPLVQPLVGRVAVAQPRPGPCPDGAIRRNM